MKSNGSDYLPETIGHATLYNCDAFPLLLHWAANGDQFDQVMTDPPYDKTTHQGARYAFTANESEIDFDPLNNADDLARLLITVSKRWAIAFCAMEMLGDYKRGAGDAWIRSGFWRKPNGAPQFTGDRPDEQAALARRRAPRFL